MELLIAAFITGLFGSMHCAGMCGPLAIAFNMRGGGNSFLNAVIYNASRIFAYALLGLIFGLIGFGFSLAGWQQIISILSGILILIFVFGKKYFSGLNNGNSFFQKFVNKIRSLIQQQFSKHTLRSASALGFLNGLLPCGLVYIAIAGAVVSGNALDGSLYMILFGLGTFPLMFFFAVSGNYLSVKKRLLLRKSLPVFSIIIACLLIIRGLNLGIPYLSPQFEAQHQAVVCCTPE